MPHFFQHWAAPLKSGTLKRLGILGVPEAVLADLIRAKLKSNYIYNLAFSEDFGVAKFNIMLELEAVDTGEPIRVLASLEFQERGGCIRLITMYSV